MSDLPEFLSIRNEAEKWSHPEIIDSYSMMLAAAANLADTIFNPDLPFEQRKGYAKAQENAIVSMTPPLTEEQQKRYKVFEAPGCPEEPEAGIDVQVAWPENATSKMKAMYVIAGGGLFACQVAPGRLVDTADRYQAVVVSLHYRTIFDFEEGKGGYPGTLNDLHAGYQWMIEHADEIGIDPDLVVINGESSGGHLSLTLCHRLKRYNWCGGPKPRGVVACYPIVDDREKFDMYDVYTGSWDGASMRLSNNGWLGENDRETLTGEAFANRASVADCIGLPPTFIHVDETDPSVCAVQEYVAKLVAAGVFTEHHEWGGSSHATLSLGTMISPESPYVQRFVNMLDANINDCWKYDLRRAWIDELMA